MNKIKKIWILMILSLVLVFISGCNTTGTKEVVSKLTILTVNDFHGALTEDEGEFGAARLAGAMLAEAKKAEATVMISAGDMFQGTALSNYNHGKTVIDIMNIMGFDVMALGNHEFDWGYDAVYQFVDGNKDNGEANFPYLGCNIIEKSTGEMPKGVKGYQVIERGGLKVGIIGFMGEENESDIAEAMIKDYEFVNPLPIIKEIATDLRANQGVNVVIVVGHQGNELNDLFASFTGDARIDAIVNSHSHGTYSETVIREDGVRVPCVQAGSSGEKYASITLEINKETKEVTGGTAVIRRNNGTTKNSKVQDIVNDLVKETEPVFGRVIGIATENVARYGAADWAATALKEYAKTDIAVINIGGIRSQAFPIKINSEIKVSNIHEIMPFDNVLKTVDLKGSAVRAIVNKSDFIMSANVTKNNSTGEIYINGELLDEDKTYSVATIDYIFDKPENPFLRGENIVNTGVLFRDILIAKVEADQTIRIPIRGEYE